MKRSQNISPGKGQHLGTTSAVTDPKLPRLSQTALLRLEEILRRKDPSCRPASERHLQSGRQEASRTWLFTLGYPRPLYFPHEGSTILFSLLLLLLSCFRLVQLFAILWTGACQAPLSTGKIPSKNTRVGCHVFLKVIFPTQGLNPCLLHYRLILYH